MQNIVQPSFLFEGFNSEPEPDFDGAKDTGISFDHAFENHLKKRVAYSIKLGSENAGYSSQTLSRLVNVTPSQFSKVINGETWLSIDGVGRWGFATGVIYTDLINQTIENAGELALLVWFISGRLCGVRSKEFCHLMNYICAKYYLPAYEQTVEEECVPKLESPEWCENYLEDYHSVLSKRICQLREYLDISLNRMAEILGVSLATVKRYETGQHRIARGAFSGFRLCATLNVKSIEMLKGSQHHQLRYTQLHRQKQLYNCFKDLPVTQIPAVKALVLAASK